MDTEAQQEQTIKVELQPETEDDEIQSAPSDIEDQTETFGIENEPDMIKEKSHSIMMIGEDEPKKKRYPCSYCEYSSHHHSNIVVHEKIHTGERPFSCDICGKAFGVKASLKKHKRIHTGEQPYTCKYCDKTFTSLYSLNVHERTHTGEKPYVCQHCDKCFAHRSDLVKHERIHTGVKPYSCNECGKSFTQKLTLKHHERVHTGEKPYSCDICNLSFTHASNLKRHFIKCKAGLVVNSLNQRIHHSKGEKAICKICKRAFKSNYIGSHEIKCEKMIKRKAEREERKRANKERKLANRKCNKCNKTFSSKNYLGKHEQICKAVSIKKEFESEFAAKEELPDYEDKSETYQLQEITVKTEVDDNREMIKEEIMEDVDYDSESNQENTTEERQISFSITPFDIDNTEQEDSFETSTEYHLKHSEESHLANCDEISTETHVIKLEEPIKQEMEEETDISYDPLSLL
eukprot:TRINITY_DN15576_c0_g1_i1.p1 TRINITY_DN15576_c0_g1~~TRINITY_DN15576_c0_g1_i1.p1  ORF type:complete len:462 (-),score=41.70 TRINITY_DN15576_c0_g1_i1:378-1763(-)